MLHALARSAYILSKYERLKMLEASLHITEHLPEGAKGIWALVHCAAWMALGELEWVPFQVLRKSVDINLLGKRAACLVESIMRFGVIYAFIGRVTRSGPSNANHAAAHSTHQRPCRLSIVG